MAATKAVEFIAEDCRMLAWAITKFTSQIACYTLKTGTPFEDGNSILKLLWGVSRTEIQLGAFRV